MGGQTVTGEEKRQAIRVGDRFRMRSGSEWKVIWIRPGGFVDLFCTAQSRFATRYTHEVRKMERLS